jgi:uncharacterized membrane protein
LLLRQGDIVDGCCGERVAQEQPPGAPDSDPMSIVRQRLARGEITAEEYATIRRALQG